MVSLVIWAPAMWLFCLWWWSSGHRSCDCDDLVVEIGPCAAHALMLLYMLFVGGLKGI